MSIPPRDQLRHLFVALPAAVDLPKFPMQAKSKPTYHTLATSKTRRPSGHSKQAPQAKRKQARTSIPPRDLLWPPFIALPTAVDLPKFQMQAKSKPTCHKLATGHSKQPLQAKQKQARMSIPPRDLLWPRSIGLATALDALKLQMQPKSKPNCHTLPTSKTRRPSGHSKQALQAKRKQARMSIPPRDLPWPPFIALPTAVDLPKFQMQAKSKPTCHILAILEKIIPLAYRLES